MNKSSKKITESDLIIEKITEIKNGRMARIGYRTDLPIKATYKKVGVHIYKVVETTARFGCKYSNLSSVIKKRLSKSDDSTKDTTTVTNNEWIVPNKIYRNTVTGKVYVRFSPLNHGGSNKKNVFILEIEGAQGSITFMSKDMIPDTIKEMVQDSYWKDRTPPDVQSVLADNIIFVK